MEKKEEFPTQFGIAQTADFEERTWTFLMPEGFYVASGEFAIVPKSTWVQILKEFAELTTKTK